MKKHQIGPNFTAWFVLQGTIAAIHHPSVRAAKDPEELSLYGILSQTSSNTRLLSKIIYWLPYHWQYRIGECVTIPGRLRHFYLRKKSIEKQVRKFLNDADSKQVIVLGAGLDILSLKLAHEYPHAHFIEIDTKESQAFKESALLKNNMVLPENMEIIAGDLRNPLSEILLSSKLHDAASRTIWIGEGLFMFLPENDVRRIFKEMGANSGSHSLCVFTTLPYREQGTPLSKWIQKLYLKKENSLFRWVIPCQEVPAFMQGLGYSILEQISYHALHKDYASGLADAHVGEDIHIALIT